MPIPVQCAGCAVKLNAPDAAAGKRLKCPKCGQPVAVPAPAPPVEDLGLIDEPVELKASPRAKPPEGEADERPVRPRKKRADDEPEDRPRKKRAEASAEDAPDEVRPRGRRRREDAEKPPAKKSGSAMLIVAIVGGVLLLAGGAVVAWQFLKDDGPEVAGQNPNPRPNPFNPGPVNPGPVNPGPGPVNPGPGPVNPGPGPANPGPLTPTDLTSKGLHATIDLPAGTTFGTGFMDRIKLPRGASFDIRSEDKEAVDNYFDGQMAKGTVVEKTDTATLAEVKNQFGGGSTYHMRAAVPIGDRKIVVKQTVYGTRAEADATWAVVKTLRQSEAQQKAEKPRQEALAKFKAADLYTFQGNDGVFVTFGKSAPELLPLLKDIPDLTGLSLFSFGDAPSAENAKILPQLPHLRKLTVAGTDEELVSVGRCPELTELTLASPRATDAGLAPLGNLTKLTALNLSNARITGSGLAVLKKMPALANLHLSNVPLADDSLAHLSGMPELSYLTLARSGVTDAGVRHLTGLTKLSSLNLTGTAVTGATLDALAGSPKLDSLDLAESAVTDGGLGQAGRVTVRTATLNRTRVGDTGLAAVAKWGRLTNLHLSDTNVTDAGLRVLAGTKVESLDLRRTAVTDKGPLALSDSPALSSLTLNECPVTDAVVAAALRCPKLSSLGLQQTAVSDAALAPLARLGKDRYLSVYASGTKVTAAAAKAATRNSVNVYADEPKDKTPVRKTVSADPKVPLDKLKPADPEKLFKALNADPDRDEDKPGKPVVGVFLSRDTPPLTDLELAEIRDLKTLRELTVGSDAVTDGGLAYLAGLAGLEELSLFSCGNVTGSGFVHLQKLPKLKRLKLPYPKDSRQYTAADLRPLVDLKTLEEVEIPAPESLPVLFDFYGRLPNLKKLVVIDSVRGTDVAKLPPLPSVAEFRLAPYSADGSLRGWATAGFADLKGATVVEIGPAVDDAAAEHLAKAGAARELTVTGHLLTDRGWKALSGMPNLTVLTVKHGHLGGAELAALTASPKMEELILDGGTLGDPTLAGLAGAKGLAVLRVKNLRLTDAALDAIAKLPKLEAVEFAGTAVTKAGVNKLRQAKPKLDVQFAGEDRE